MQKRRRLFEQRLTGVGQTNANVTTIVLASLASDQPSFLQAVKNARQRGVTEMYGIGDLTDGSRL